MKEDGTKKESEARKAKQLVSNVKKKNKQTNKQNRRNNHG